MKSAMFVRNPQVSLHFLPNLEIFKNPQVGENPQVQKSSSW